MTPSHQPLIAAEGLTRSFGSPRTGDRVEVLRGIDVTIPRGTMLADVVLVMRDGLIRRRLTSPAPGDVLAAAEEAGRNA